MSTVLYADGGTETDVTEYNRFHTYAIDYTVGEDAAYCRMVSASSNQMGDYELSFQLPDEFALAACERVLVDAGLALFGECTDLTPVVD